MDEQKLIQEIRSLYDDLKAEEKGSYLPGSGFRCIEPPSGVKYRFNAKKLLDKAIELSKINPDKYRTCLLQLLHTMEKEVDFVGDYSYEYYKGTNKPTAKSLEKMVCLMKDATGHIYRDFVGLLIPPS